MLAGQVALVTGASRGIGRGIALQLGQAGATVYVTGRAPSKSDNKDGTDKSLPTLENTANEITNRGGQGIAVYCDHSDADDVKRLFDKIEQDNDGRLDICVNNAYSGVNAIGRNADKKFWQSDPLLWDEINNVGLRNHYICSVYASRLMVPKKNGLIVIVSSGGGLQYLFNVAYGVGKAACDRMAADMGVELKKDGVTCISLWPGAVRTELIVKHMEQGTLLKGGPETETMKQMFDEGETIEYPGLAIAHLAADPNKIKKTGRIIVTADLGDEYGFKDIDGRTPHNMRSMALGLRMLKWNRLASWVPDWVKLPGWVMTAGCSKL